MTYYLKNSTRKDKKYMLVTPDNKKIHFASPIHENYTTHKDKERQ